MSMSIQKIQNLKQRIKQWKIDRNWWCFIVVPSSFLVGSTIIIGTMFVMDLFESNSEFNPFLFGIITLLVMIPPLYLLYPKKPTEADVLNDIALRKAFRMDSSVSDEKE